MTKEKILKMSVAMLAFVGLCSCSSDDGRPSSGNGVVDIELSIDKNLTSVDPIELDWINEVEASHFSVALSACDGGYSKTWDSFVDFPGTQVCQTGEYILQAHHGSIDEEGFECPFFYGEQQFSVVDGDATHVDLECRMANSVIVTKYTDSYNDYFVDYSVTYHSEGKSYLTVDKEESRPLFVHPGEISIFPSVKDNEGAEVTFDTGFKFKVEPQHAYCVSFDVLLDSNNDRLIAIKIDGKLVDDGLIPADESVFNAPLPLIDTYGFSSGIPLEIVEGTSTIDKIESLIVAKSGLKSLKMSTNLPVLLNAGIPAELDLVSATDDQRLLLSDLGVKISDIWKIGSNGGKIDFTDMLPNIRNLNGDHGFITLVAVDNLNKASRPSTLSVSFNEVNVTVSDVQPVTLGCYKADIIVSSSSNFDEKDVSFIGEISEEWVRLDITRTALQSENRWKYTVELPNGVKDVPIKLLYNDIEKVDAVIPRAVPQYSIVSDPMATIARFQIVTENKDALEAITSNVVIKTDDGYVRVIERNTETGLLVVTGLVPSTLYRIFANPLPGNGNAGFQHKTSIKTEGTKEVPDGNFENAELIENIEKLPQGGRYSQTNVAIFNHQNFWSYDYYLPKKYWSTVNKKTFCHNAKTRNTWYMYPSTMVSDDSHVGNRAMLISSVGWDINGGPIEDYEQKAGEYIPYNPNVPNVTNRAAGKLFLGDYSYDAATGIEEYREGIKFVCRPRAFNGYYKYLPALSCPSDKGLVKIELVRVEGDRETVVSSGTTELKLSPDYVPFSVPLDYPLFDVVPTHLRIMFSSTTEVGDIEYETMNVKTDIDIINSRLRGSMLWVDNLTFTY